MSKCPQGYWLSCAGTGRHHPECRRRRFQERAIRRMLARMWWDGLPFIERLRRGFAGERRP